MAQIFSQETPVEYFKEMVEQAIKHQRLQVTQMTAFYLVDLLYRFIKPEARPDFVREDGEPLALRLLRALEAGGIERQNRLRALGDVSLFTSGYFSDSLRRKLVDVDYYIALGGHAYQSLSRHKETAFSFLFAELSESFVGFVDVLSEVSESSGLTSDTDLMRAYEKWLRTRSLQSAEKLKKRGIVPNSSIGRRFIQ